MNTSTPKLRNSNLELYRIICMVMIVAYHYMVNSGLAAEDGPVVNNPLSANSMYLACFGAWGKVGINCFLMITGYYMCTSSITFRKFLKLILQIYLYRFVLFFIFLVTGYEHCSLKRAVMLLLPDPGLGSGNFVSCFLVFWLTIPFLNILIHGLNKRQHELLIVLSLFVFSFLGSVPKFDVPLNYITWFGIIYFIASYIRLYPSRIFDRKKMWGWLTLLTLFMSLASIAGMQYLFGGRGIEYSFFFVDDCNKILAVLFAFCSFLWFKNLNLKYSKVINAFGAGTFGVLLIHANSSAMRTWLWEDTVNCVGHYSLPLGHLALFSIGVVLAIFIICNLIDQLRIATLEKWFFKWYDNSFSDRMETLICKLIKGKHNND